jgi:hypothetical protein
MLQFHLHNHPLQIPDRPKPPGTHLLKTGNFRNKWEYLLPIITLGNARRIPLGDLGNLHRK